MPTVPIPSVPLNVNVTKVSLMTVLHATTVTNVPLMEPLSLSPVQ